MFNFQEPLWNTTNHCRIRVFFLSQERAVGGSRLSLRLIKLAGENRGSDPSQSQALGPRSLTHPSTLFSALDLVFAVVWAVDVFSSPTQD
jgi:hypothetical protein